MGKYVSKNTNRRKMSIYFKKKPHNMGNFAYDKTG